MRPGTSGDREMRSIMTPEDILYVHVTGTDQSTPVSRQEVQAAIAEGRILPSQLIWSPPDQAWKPVRELSSLLPHPKPLSHSQQMRAAMPSPQASGAGMPVPAEWPVALAAAGVRPTDPVRAGKRHRRGWWVYAAAGMAIVIVLALIMAWSITRR